MAEVKNQPAASYRSPRHTQSRAFSEYIAAQIQWRGVTKWLRKKTFGRANQNHRNSTNRSPSLSNASTRSQRSSIQFANARLVVLPHRNHSSPKRSGKRSVRKSSSLLIRIIESVSARLAISASLDAPIPMSVTCCASYPCASNQRHNPGGNCASIRNFILPR